MYLSQIYLNPRSRQVQREIADAYQLHRTVMHAFPAHLGEAERVLFRLEITPHTRLPALLVQSQSQPDWGWLGAGGMGYLLPARELPDGAADNPSVKEVSLALHNGQLLAFRLRANPTVKKPHPDTKQGQREGIFDEDEQMDWLKRKVELAGGRLVSARQTSLPTLKTELLRQKQRHELTLAAAQFEGLLQVMAAERLVEAVKNGIGPGKGLGFGLLSLARAPAEE